MEQAQIVFDLFLPADQHSAKPVHPTVCALYYPSSRLEADLPLRACASSLYVNIKASPLDGGPEQVSSCSRELLNSPGKVSFFHTARPIQKARTSLALFLSGTDDEKVVLRAPQ